MGETEFSVSGGKYADEAFPEIYKGMNEFALTSGGFMGADLIRHVVEKIGPCYVDSAAWYGSVKSIRGLMELGEAGNIVRLRVLMSTTAIARKADVTKQAVDMLGDAICFAPTHAKMHAIYNRDFQVVIETSANLNANNVVEQYRVIEDFGHAKFIRSFFDEMWRCRDANDGNAVSKAQMKEFYK